MANSDLKLERLVSTGAAYSNAGDARDFMGKLFAAIAAASCAGGAVYVSVTDRWSTASVALIAGSALSAAFGFAVPWRSLGKGWQLSMFWLSVAGITAGAYVLEVPMLALLMLLPMMAVAYMFGRDRWIVVPHILAAMGAFALPSLTGEAQDSTSQLMVTLPAIVAVTVLAGVLADRFQSMRRTERDRYKATIEALSTALTARDGYTGSHSQETLSLVQGVCDELALSANEAEYVADVALLHDIGKIGIPNEVLHAPGRLDESQWEIMKQHPVIGERIVATVPGLEEVARAIRHEHEHWDGSGYPDSLHQGLIPIASRIVLVCDAFHAMTSDRPYRAAMTIEQARLELSRCAGTQFDPVVVGALLHVLERRVPETYSAEQLSAELAGAGLAGAHG
ncbi:MAG TPA: HD domain-containing phosphohydrolase [Solirubrobacterales bacterium]|jgi:hypothetical protein|nr:HD domain-containing phosphohydrolase [Solirubrobacterales bacterium]